jgi:choice-of-anchor A domain-containing protein
VNSNRHPSQFTIFRTVALFVFSFAVCLAVSAPLALAASDLGAAKGFAVLSSGGDVSMKNHVNIGAVSASGSVACPGNVGCPSNMGGTTILMGRGNASAPDTVSGDVIGSASSPQGLNCAGNPPGTTTICLGNDSEIAGQCVTGGGAVSSPSECATGTDTSGTNPELTTTYAQAGSDATAFSASLASLAATQSLSAITLGSHGSATISGGAGMNVVMLPSITTGTKSTITINAGSTEFVIVNIGTSTDPGSLQLGNGASIVLSGGITPDHVIFNLIGTGTAAQLGNGTVFNGTILAPQGQFTSGDGNTPTPVLINGALLFGGSISIGNNTNLNFYPYSGTTGGSSGGSSGSSSAAS